MLINHIELRNFALFSANKHRWTTIRFLSSKLRLELYKHLCRKNK